MKKILFVLFILFNNLISIQGSDNARILGFEYPTGNVSRGSRHTISVTIENTGSTTRSFWIGLSFAHESATWSQWPLKWYDIKPKETRILNPHETEVIEFDILITESYAPGQYYIISKVWNDFDSSTGLMVSPTYDETILHEEWEGNLGVTSMIIPEITEDPDNILDQIFNVLKYSVFDNGNPIEMYQNGCKPLLFFRAQGDGSMPGVAYVSAGATFLIDLADLYQITPEGKEHYVTCWLDADATLGIGADLENSLQIGGAIGIIKQDFDPTKKGIADYRKFVSGNIQGNIPGFAITFADYSSTGGVNTIPRIEWTGSAGLSLEVNALNEGLISFELNYEIIKNAFVDAFSQNRNIKNAIIELTKSFIETSPVRSTTFDDGDWPVYRGEVNHNISMDYKSGFDDDWFEFANWYYVDVPKGATNLTFSTLGGNGELGMFYKYGSRPSFYNPVDYDGLYIADNTVITRRIANPHTGRYYISLPVNSDGLNSYANIDLVVDYDLDYNVVPILTDYSCTPDVGDEDTEFKFSVDYYDADGDVPIDGEAKLYISGTHSFVLDMTLESGEAYNGTYSCTTKLPIGTYHYYILFTNNSNQLAFTELQDAPQVHNSKNMTFIPVLSCGVEETSEIVLRYKINDEPYIKTILAVGTNPGFEVPPSGSVSLSLSTEGNYKFKEYKLIQDGRVVWNYGHSGTRINFTDYASGVFTLNIDLSYTPQDYTVSGVIVNEDNTPYAESINLTVKSSQQSLSNNFSSGSFGFFNVDGGVPVEVIASGAPVGYQINPAVYTIKNLDRDKVGFKFQISSNDQLAPIASLVEKPDEQSETNEVLFSWIGSDDVSTESNLLYQYKLDGVDSDYSDWGNAKTASYNLPNGIYTFLINCKDEAGNYRNTPLTYKFIVNANPQIVSVSKYEKGVWASKVTLKNSGTKNTAKQVVLLPEHSLTNFESIVPVRLYKTDDYSLMGGLDIIANTAETDTVFTSENNGFIFHIPEEFLVTDTLEYIIEWGVHSKFGWQDTQSTPAAFPDLVNNPPFDVDMEDRYLDENGSIWRVATYKKKILTDKKYIYNAWAYVDKANSDEILINQKELENIQGSWESGVRYTRPECSDASIFKLGNNIAVVIREEKYERTYPSDDYLDSNYDRYVVKILNSSGTVIKSITGEWQLDYNCYVPKKQINNQIWIDKRYFNDTQKGLCFSIIDKNGNVIQENYEYYTAERTHSLYNGGCYSIGANNTIILFEDSWENINNDDRANICFQIRNSNGDLVKGTTVLNPALMGDNFDNRDEYQIDDVITDNHGRVWIAYEHDLGSEKSIYYVVIDGSGNIIHGPVKVENDIDFYTCDKDNYVWMQWGNYIYLYDDNFNESRFNKQDVIAPNQNTLDRVAYVWYDHYNNFDRWSPQLISVAMNETNLVDEIEIFNDPINNDVKVKSLELNVNGADIYSGGSFIQESISINENDGFTIGNNLISINQDALLGGNLIIILPIVFNKKPQLIIPFSDIILKEDFGDTTLMQSLNETFSDDQELNYQIEYNNAIMQATIGDNKLNLTSVKDQFGNCNFIVKADDGIFNVSDTFEILILPVNDAPIIPNSQEFKIDENSNDESLVGKILASDVDNNQLDYTIISGNTNDAFKLNDSTGEISVYNSLALDYEASSQFNLEVNVSDGQDTTQGNIIVKLNDVVEVGINEITLDNPIQIYPNPTKGTLKLEGDVKVDRIKIYNLVGELVFEENFKTDIDISHFNDGVYFIKLYSNTELLQTNKIVVTK